MTLVFYVVMEKNEMFCLTFTQVSMFFTYLQNVFLSINNHLICPDVYVFNSICETRISFVTFVDIL